MKHCQSDLGISNSKLAWNQIELTVHVIYGYSTQGWNLPYIHLILNLLVHVFINCKYLVLPKKVSAYREKKNKTTTTESVK